jgi:hypothetical protein
MVDDGCSDDGRCSSCVNLLGTRSLIALTVDLGMCRGDGLLSADFDLDVYKSVYKSADKATKWIETEGGAAAGKAKSYAPVVVLGVAVVVVVVVAIRKGVTKRLG